MSCLGYFGQLYQLYEKYQHRIEASHSEIYLKLRFIPGLVVSVELGRGWLQIMNNRHHCSLG